MLQGNLVQNEQYGWFGHIYFIFRMGLRVEEIMKGAISKQMNSVDELFSTDYLSKIIGT